MSHIAERRGRAHDGVAGNQRGGFTRRRHDQRLLTEASRHPPVAARARDHATSAQTLTCVQSPAGRPANSAESLRELQPSRSVCRATPRSGPPSRRPRPVAGLGYYAEFGHGEHAPWRLARGHHIEHTNSGGHGVLVPHNLATSIGWLSHGEGIESSRMNKIGMTKRRMAVPAVGLLPSAGPAGGCIIASVRRLGRP